LDIVANSIWVNSSTLAPRGTYQWSNITLKATQDLTLLTKQVAADIVSLTAGRNLLIDTASTGSSNDLKINSVASLGGSRISTRVNEESPFKASLGQVSSIVNPPYQGDCDLFLSAGGALNVSLSSGRRAYLTADRLGMVGKSISVNGEAQLKTLTNSDILPGITIYGNTSVTFSNRAALYGIKA
jgi:hypothetical protein